LVVSAGENVLGAALAAGIPLPHSCRAGRCATCKARLVSGDIAYPDDKLPPGIVASEAARGEVLLCQAMPRSDLRIQSRTVSNDAGSACGVAVKSVQPLSMGGQRVCLQLLGNSMLRVQPGQFIDVETATGERERVAVVAADGDTLHIELHECDSDVLVRARGPFDTPR
jgi:CDP-4-dehydro-6-deoxyglucose reductase